MSGFLSYHDALEWLCMVQGWSGPVCVLVVRGDHYEGARFDCIKGVVFVTLRESRGK